MYWYMYICLLIDWLPVGPPLHFPSAYKALQGHRPHNAATIGTKRTVYHNYNCRETTGLKLPLISFSNGTIEQ